MRPGSVVAIYILFWVMSFFFTLPFGVRTHDEAGVAKHPGQADSAPYNFSFGRQSLRATFLSLILFGLFFLNYHYGWIGAQSLVYASPPPTN
jgi:predicted secreted protein